MLHKKKQKRLDKPFNHHDKSLLREVVQYHRQLEVALSSYEVSLPAYLFFLFRTLIQMFPKVENSLPEGIHYG
jgi:hypothetical protein